MGALKINCQLSNVRSFLLLGSSGACIENLRQFDTLLEEFFHFRFRLHSAFDDNSKPDLGFIKLFKANFNLWMKSLVLSAARASA
jgi:hypothetical protein